MMSCQFMIPFATHIDVQIVYLDFSPTSLATAQSRAEARNLKNILWVILNKVLPIFEFIWSVCFTVFALYSSRTSETILPKRSMTRLKTFPALIWDTLTSSTAMVLVRISLGLGLTEGVHRCSPPLERSEGRSGYLGLSAQGRWRHAADGLRLVNNAISILSIAFNLEIGMVDWEFITCSVF